MPWGCLASMAPGWKMALCSRVSRDGTGVPLWSAYPIPSHPIPSHPLLSSPIPSYPILSHPIPSHPLPVPSHPIPLIPSHSIPQDTSLPRASSRSMGFLLHSVFGAQPRLLLLAVLLCASYTHTSFAAGSQLQCCAFPSQQHYRPELSI